MHSILRCSITYPEPFSCAGPFHLQYISACAKRSGDLINKYLSHGWCDDTRTPLNKLLFSPT